jgi:hypothetical protein
MVTLNTDSAGMFAPKDVQNWRWALLAVVLVLAGIWTFMLAGIGLYLITMGRHCG